MSQNKPNAQTALSLIFLQAVVAILGSLYFSNHGDPVENFRMGEWFPGEGFDPCNLCWWARILMYPMVLISLGGIWFKDEGALRYCLMLSFPGLCLEIYHYGLQKFDFGSSAVCTFNNPCTGMSVDYFDFVTIPLMCLVAFLFIVVLSLWGMKKSA